MGFLLLFFLLCSNAYAQNVVIITQYGYITNNNGNIIGKYDNDINTGKQVTLPNGYTYTSVVSEDALNTIQVYQPPPPPPTTADLIAQDEQALAIADLQSKGVLTDDQATAQTANLTALNTAVTAASATAASVTTGTTGATQVNGT